MNVIIVGTGPAGLMCATETAIKLPDAKITLIEKRPQAGRKLLIAGASGLNISHDGDPDFFAGHYEGFSKNFWKDLFKDFGRDAWIRFIEKELKHDTFKGTSDRYFVSDMKGAKLLQSWIHWLQEKGVQFSYQTEVEDWDLKQHQVWVIKSGVIQQLNCDALVFACGGASWQKEPLTWVGLLEKKGVRVNPFSPANVGFSIQAPADFFKETDGKPLKRILLKGKKGEKMGDLVVTQTGLEGTPVYFLGESGDFTIDLRPDLTHQECKRRCLQVKENLSPIRRVKKKLDLCDASFSLLFHLTTQEERSNMDVLIEKLKALPLQFLDPRPLSEAISSRGGVCLSEMSENLELKKEPGVFVIGEMLDWHAPTGGFLIQASISMGARIAKVLSWGAFQTQ